MATSHPLTLTGRLARAAMGDDGTSDGWPRLHHAPRIAENEPPGALGLRFLDRDETARYVTYPELYCDARRLAGALIALGLQKGDRVGLVLPTSVDFPLAFFGVELAGGIPVPLYPPLRLGRIAEYHERSAGLLRCVRARLVLTDQRIGRIIGATVAAASPALGCHQVAALLRQADPSAPSDLPHPATDDIALIQFSSGTVADPKPICLTHRQVLANATRILDQLFSAYPATDVCVHAGASWLPLYHDMGLVGCLMVAIVHPGELTLIPPELFVARPAIWLRTIARYRATISPAPNFAYALCASRIRDEELEGIDLSSWCAALNGAEPVTAQVLERFIARFARYGLREQALTPVYGLAEATLAVTFSPIRERFGVRRFDAERLLLAGQASEIDSRASEPASIHAAPIALASVGFALPGFELQIRGEDGDLLPDLALGRLWVRGPSIMVGYDDNGQATQAALVDGWLDTGDEGFLSNNELFIYGRAKDIIILNGRNYAPQQIEQAIDDVEGVRTGCSAAIGVIESAGERLYLLVEHTLPRTRQAEPKQKALEAEVSRHVSQRLGLRPERVVLLAPGTLPRTSSGKIRRNEARRRYLTQTLDAPEKVTPFTVGRELVRSHLSMRRARKTNR